MPAVDQFRFAGAPNPPPAPTLETSTMVLVFGLMTVMRRQAADDPVVCRDAIVGQMRRALAWPPLPSIVNTPDEARAYELAPALIEASDALRIFCRSCRKPCEMQRR